MLNYEKISLLFEEVKFSKMDFYEKIGMTSKGFSDMIRKKTMKVTTLEKIAAYFDKPIYYFFDEEVAPPEDNTVNYQLKYYETLEKLNAALERMEELRSQYENEKNIRKSNKHTV